MKNKDNSKGCIIGVIALIAGIFLAFEFISGGASLLKHLTTSAGPGEMILFIIIIIAVIILLIKN